MIDLISESDQHNNTSISLFIHSTVKVEGGFVVLLFALSFVRCHPLPLEIFLPTPLQTVSEILNFL